MVTFKVMTWNVENLFCPEAGADVEAQQQYQDKLTLLAMVINGQDADVVALQEVGGEEPLADIQNVLGGTYPHRAVSTFPDSRGIRVAFLSKLAVDQKEDIVDFSGGPALEVHGLTEADDSVVITRMGRGAVHIRVSKNGLTVDLITAHLKSKLLTYPRPGRARFSPRDEKQRAQIGGIAIMRRTAEAVTLRIYVNGFLKGNSDNPLVLLGDFNDVPEAQTSLILNGPTGSEIGTGGFHRKDKGDDVRLFNLAPVIPAERRYSRVHNGRGELLDQIFVSEELLPFDVAERHRQLPDVNSHIDFKDQLHSVGDDADERADEIAPDHAPVTATFDL